MNSDNKKIFMGFLFLAGLLCFTCFCGCEIPSDNIEPTKKLSISAFLKDDSSGQKVMLFRTLATNERRLFYSLSSYLQADSTENVFICDAMVYVTDSLEYNGTYSYKKEQFSNQSYKDSTRTKVIPGRKYYLRAETVYGAVHGSTQLPGNFGIESPRDKDILSIEGNKPYELDVKWTESAGAYGYIVELEIREIQNQPGPVMPGYYPVESYITRNNYCPVRIRNYNYGWGNQVSRQYIIRVIAFDKNFYDHHFDMCNSAGVSGAYGYFASGVTKTVTLYDK